MANLATIQDNILADSGIDPINLIVGTGTINYIPVFTAEGSIGNSIMTQSGSNILISSNIVLHAGNFNSYAPTLTGGGASGTWGINISGNAATATNANNADTVDGLHASAFALTGGSNATGTWPISVTGTSGYANSAGTAGLVTGTSGGAIQSWDIRTIAPSSMTSGRLGFGFTSWNNDNTAPWADYLHLRSYTDGSGGNDNLIMFLKSGIGMRIYQQAWGSSAPYAAYADVLHSLNYNSYAPTLTGGGASGTWGISITGNADTLDGYHASAFALASSLSNYLPLAGGTMSGGIYFANNIGTVLQGTMADNDFWRIYAQGNANAGYLEIATSDDGTEPIYFSQYTGVFNTLVRRLTLLDANGNTSFPGFAESNSSFRAPIFYDSQDTNYYLDPAGFSNLKAISLDGVSVQYGTAISSPTSNFGNGRAYLYVWPTASGGRIVSFKINISTTWNWAPGFGFISADVSFYFDGTNLNSATTTITSATGAARIHLGIGQPVLANGFVAIPIYSANSNAVFVKLDGSPSFAWNVVSWGPWESVAFPGSAVVNIPGDLSVDGNINMAGNLVATQSWVQSNYVPTSRTLTINGVTYDLSANRSWTIAAGVTSIVAGTGISVNQAQGDVTISNTGVLSVNGGTGAITGIATTAQLANYLPLAGGTMSGSIAMGGNNITNVSQLSHANGRIILTGNLHIDAFNGNAIYLQYYNQGVTTRIYGDIDMQNYNTTNVNIGYANNSFRAPIFYDSNDTTFYVDPNSLSNLYTLRVGNGAEVPGLIGMGASFLYGMGVSGAYTAVHAHPSANGVALGSYNGSTFTPKFYVNHDGNAYAITGMYAPVFYDSNDTSYYINPNGTSIVNTISGVNMRVSNAYYWGSGNVYMNYNGTTLNTNVAITSDTYMSAPLYYDSDNGAFYGNFAGTSRFNITQINSVVDQNYYRITNPEGGINVNSGPLTGAIKIKLPPAASFINVMMSLTVQIYNYQTGTSRTIRCGGYNYFDGSWYNVFAYQIGDNGTDTLNVRFGVDGTSNCIWIGETSTYWSYPNVFITDIQAGHSQSSFMAYGWNVSFVTAFDTVQTNREAYFQINAGNIASQSVSYAANAGNANTLDGYDSSAFAFANGSNAAGTWGISISGNSATTSQTNFTTLTLNSQGVATQSWVNSQGFATGGPFLALAGGTMAGAINMNGNNINSAEAIYSSIYYDRNDTGYYGDFAGISRLSGVAIGESYYGHGYPGIVQSGSTSYNYNFLNGSWSSNVTAGYLANCSDEWEFVIHDGGNSVESVFIYAGGRILMGRSIGWGTTYIEAAESFRAPIFYDSNDTGYYVDPNSTSVLYYLQLNAAESMNLYGIRGRFTNEYIHLYNKVGVGDPNGWGAGQTSTPTYGLSTYGGANFAYGNGALSTFNGQVNIKGSSMYVTPSQLHIGQQSSGTAQMSFESWGSYTGAIAMNSAGQFHWGGQGASSWFWKTNCTYNGDYSASGTTIMSLGSSGNLTSYSYQGNGNVDGTGSASYHPSGFYSTASSWLYGTLYMNGNNQRAIGGIVQNDLMGRPNAQWGAGGSSTGAVVIKFPGNTGNYGMVHAVIDIYEYNGNNVSTVIVGGHNWGSQWYSYGANVVGYTNKQVRVGVKDGKYCIIIGDGSSTWSYGQVVLRKIQNGAYYSGVMDVGAGYTIGIESDTYSWVSGDLRTFRSSGSMYMNEQLVATQSWVNSQGFVTGGPFLPLAGGTVTGTTNFNAGVNFASQTNWFGGYGPGSGPGIALENISTFARFAFWGLDFYDWNHGIQMTLDNGYVSVNNYLQAGNSLRAPIFYDSNDTYYYVDPNSVSQLSSMKILGELKFQNGSYYNNLNYWGARFYSQDDGNGIPLYAQVQWVGTWYTALKIASGLDDNNPSLRTFGRTQLATDGGNVSIGGLASSYKLHVYGTAYATDDMRAPIFYDSQDTGYYLDPNGNSNLYATIAVEARARKNQSDNNYTTAALWTESYGGTTTGIAFHISGNVGKFLEMRTNGVLYWENNPVITSGNYTSYAVPTSGYTFGTAFTIGTMYVSTGIQGSGLSYVLGTYSNGYTYRFDSTAFSSWIGLGNYLPLSGGTMTGQMYGPSVGSDAYGGLIQVRERGYVSNSQSDWSYSPAITFHWGNRFAKRLGFDYDGYLAVDNVRYLNASNYNSYAPTLTGGGASGTWSISITGSAGSVPWSNVTSKPANWLTEPNLIYDNVPDNLVPSGFWQSYLGAGNPTGTWFNYVNVRHSNTGNGHGYQIGMSYYDNNLWFRSYQGNGSFLGWSRALGTYTDPYPSNMNQYVRTTDTVTFAAGTFTNDVNSRVLYLKGSGNIIQFQDAAANNKWEVVGRQDAFYVYKNDGAGTGYIWQVFTNGTSNFYTATTFSSTVTATGFFESSDARLKTVVDEDYRVDSILSIKPKFYQKNGKFEAGYIAQEVEGVYEHAVNLGDDGYLSLSYTQIHTLKIAALEDSVDDIKKKIKELEEKLNTLY